MALEPATYMFCNLCLSLLFVLQRNRVIYEFSILHPCLSMRWTNLRRDDLRIVWENILKSKKQNKAEQLPVFVPLVNDIFVVLPLVIYQGISHFAQLHVQYAQANITYTLVSKVSQKYPQSQNPLPRKLRQVYYWLPQLL